MHVRTKISSWKKISSTRCRLKRNHAYFTQVQGQMGVTGCKWCDFIVYTSKGLYVERIPFEPAVWSTVRNKLTEYYFEHYIKVAAVDFDKQKLE